jgi:hypothetical protein
LGKHRDTSGRALIGAGIRVIYLVALVLALPLASLSAAADAEIYGYVWQDWNENGQWDEHEPMLANVLLTLTTLAGKKLQQAYTDQTGQYRFTQLERMAYLLVETDPEGFTSTTPNVARVDLVPKAQAQHNFGDALSIPGCFRLIDGMIWEDYDGNRRPEAGEPAREGMLVQVYDLHCNLVGLAESNRFGRYVVRGLPPERYHVVLDTHSSEWDTTGPRWWGIDLRGCHPAVVDFGVQPISVQGHPAVGASSMTGGSRSVPDGLPQGPSIVSGGVYDVGSRGQQLTGARKPLAGVTVTLTSSDGVLVAERVSDQAGRYTFEGLLWQPYYLAQSPLSNYQPVRAWLWGVAPTDGSDIVIDLENYALSTEPHYQSYLPQIWASR